jgi:diacylglycerol kinase family enzyme
VARPTAILVHNPSAGMREPTRESLTALIEEQGFRVKYRSSKRPDIAAKLEKNQGDLVIAAGGDGTIAKIAKILFALPDPTSPMAILPIGTANNIALSFGITGTCEEIIARWNEIKPRKLSQGVCRAHWGEQHFVEGVGLGSLARATTPRPGEKSKATRIRDGRIIFRDAVREAKPERLYVTVDGTRIEEEVILIEILNIRQVGPRLRLAPKANAGDRLLDVAYVATAHRQALIGWLDALIAGETDDETAGPPPCANVPGKKITIAWNGMDLRLDDKFPLMPGQAAAQAKEKEKPKKAKNGAEEEEPEHDRDQVDLLNIEIAERQLKVLASSAKTKPVAKPKRRAA